MGNVRKVQRINLCDQLILAIIEQIQKGNWAQGSKLPGEIELAKKLDRALDICMVEERKVVVTGRDTGATAQEFTDYVLDTIAKL